MNLTPTSKRLAARQTNIRGGHFYQRKESELKRKDKEITGRTEIDITTIIRAEIEQISGKHSL